MSNPKLSEAILWALLAALAFTGARFGDRWPDWVRSVLVFSGVIFLIGSILAAINWLSYVVVVRAERARIAFATTERVLMLERISSLSTDQARLVETGRLLIEVLPGSPGPAYTLRYGAARIPYGFIYDFLDRSGDDYLAPIRLWSEGTHEREYAEALTRFFCVCGYASPAAGSRSAAWIDKRAALASIDWERLGAMVEEEEKEA